MFQFISCSETIFYYGIKTLCRLANILHLTNVDVKTLWKIVKKIKVEKTGDIECYVYRPFLKIDAWESHIQAVENRLHISASKFRYQNMTYQCLENAAKIFIYLNTCPLKDFKSWFLFYKDLFYFKTPDDILLTLNRIINVKSHSQNRFWKVIAHKLFERTRTLMNYRKLVSIHNNGKKAGLYKFTLKSHI